MMRTILAVLIAVLLVAGPAVAQESTEEPEPTVSWATPTPMPPSLEEPDVDFTWLEGNSVFVDIAERGVWIWQTINQYHALDVVTSLLIIMLTLAGFRNIIRRVRRLQ